MPTQIGYIEAIFRYPVKSMRGERLEAAELGWHGLEGDRRLALRKLDDRGGFPFLTAGILPELLTFTPCRREDGAPGNLPTHVRTPADDDLPVFSEELAAEIKRRFGAPVEMMQFKNGIFDDATVSVIASGTVHEIARLAGVEPDIRRFRPNIVVRSLDSKPFEDDGWIGNVLSFGENEDAPAIAVTAPDVRCAMINIHPDSAELNPQLMKAAVRGNQNNAGVYGTVIHCGRVFTGQPVVLKAPHRASSKKA